MISALITLLVVLLIAALVFWVLRQLGLPEPIDKIVLVILVVILGIWLIYFLMGFIPSGAAWPGLPRHG